MSEIENLKIYGGATYTVGNQDIIANEWEAGKTYVKGKSYVIREHKLYVCNVTHTSVEPFDATKWTEITIGDAIAGNTTAIGDLSQLTTTVTSSLVGAVNEVNSAISYKEYVVQIGTSLWNGVYYAETNVATDVSNYGEILSALVIDESEQSDFSSHTNRACFCQVITPNVIRLYSPQASNASGHYVKYRVTFSANAVNRT